MEHTSKMLRKYETTRQQLMWYTDGRPMNRVEIGTRKNENPHDAFEASDHNYSKAKHIASHLYLRSEVNETAAVLKQGAK